MGGTKLTKTVVRSFILNKILEATRAELDELAAKYDLHPFLVCDCFENEVNRVEKFFCFPQYELDPTTEE